MAKRKSRLPNSKRPINLALQNAHVQRQFSNFSCRLKRQRATWRGSLQPRSTSPVYQVEIRYQQRQIPKAKVLSPPLAPNAPHLYGDGTLCLYWPEEWRWQQDKLVADVIIPWTALWLYYYELWLDTGRWLGPSSHDSSK